VAAAACAAAAALAGAACDEAPGASGRQPEEVSWPQAGEPAGAGSLEARWLIPPRPDLEPPLAAPLALAVDGERQRLLLLESQPPELRVYDLRDGRFVQALGREGGGPGEYRLPIDVAVSAGGTAAVLTTMGRVTFWGPDGQLVGTTAVEGGLSTDIVAAQGDTFYVKTVWPPPSDLAEFRVATPERVQPAPFFRDAEVPGTVEPGAAVRDHTYSVATLPAGDLLLAPAGPDYTILRIARNGETRQTMARPEVAPLRRSADEIADVQARVQQRFARLGRRPPRDLHVPVYRSHVAELAVAPDSTIWALTRRGGDSLAVIDAFAADGTYRATYSLKLAAAGLAVSSDALYLLTRSAFDVPGVAVAPRPRPE
jgi:hypothetical protein